MEVEFHTGVAAPVDFACRLLRKAYRLGARVSVTALPQVLQLLDRALWVFDERDFVPHLLIGAAGHATAAGRAAQARTPVWLIAGPLPAGAPPVLVNLGADIPEDLSGVARAIEIVGIDDAEPGRERWRQYRGLGWSVKHRPRNDPQEEA